MSQPSKPTLHESAIQLLHVGDSAGRGRHDGRAHPQLAHDDGLLLVADHAERPSLVARTQARVAIGVEVEEVEVGALQHRLRIDVPLGTEVGREPAHGQQALGIVLRDDFAQAIDEVHQPVGHHQALLLGPRQVVSLAVGRLGEAGVERQGRMLAEQPLLVGELPAEDGLEGRIALGQPGKQVVPEECLGLHSGGVQPIGILATGEAGVVVAEDPVEVLPVATVIGDGVGREHQVDALARGEAHHLRHVVEVLRLEAAPARDADAGAADSAGVEEDARGVVATAGEGREGIVDAIAIEGAGREHRIAVAAVLVPDEVDVVDAARHEPLAAAGVEELRDAIDSADPDARRSRLDWAVRPILGGDRSEERENEKEAEHHRRRAGDTHRRMVASMADGVKPRAR